MLRTVHFGDVDISVEQRLDLGHGGTVWDAALVLSSFLGQHPHLFSQESTVLELGSGTGLCGLVTAKLYHCQVWLTDLSQVLGLLQRNLDLNSCSGVTVRELSWESGESYGAFDFIIGSDVVYVAEAHPALVRVIQANSKPTTIVFLSFELRKEADLQFVQLMETSGWQAWKIPTTELSPDFASDDIVLYRFSRV